MFSSRASVPATRAARAVLHNEVSTFQLSARVPRGQSQQQRQYAMRAPSLSRRGPPRPAPLPSLRLNASDIPPIDHWADFESQNGLGDLTAEDALKTAILYCDMATDSSSTGKGVLERDHNIDPYTLHYTAMPLVVRAGPHLSIGLHMLVTASSLGYTPSTLTLVRILMTFGPETRSKLRTFVHDAESRFRRLLRTENNPDAFTLQGLILLQEGRPYGEALMYFDRAIAAAELANPPTPATVHHQTTTPVQPTPTLRTPRWTYEATCHHRRGLILLTQRQTDKATASFRIAALELDHAGSYVELAKRLPQGAPQRETYLLKAAQASNFEACGLLALDLAEKAADTTLPLEERVFAAKMAQEWAQVDPDASSREGVVKRVLERTGEVLGGRVWVRG